MRNDSEGGERAGYEAANRWDFLWETKTFFESLISRVYPQSSNDIFEWQIFFSVQ